MALRLHNQDEDLPNTIVPVGSFNPDQGPDPRGELA